MWIKLAFLAVTGFFLLGCYWLASNAFFLETAQYEMVEKERHFEVRDYPDLPVVTTPMQSSEDSASFRRLFRYIQGENSSETKIAMTTPVFVDDEKMNFVIPKEASRQGVPQPTGPEVELALRPKLRVVVHRFPGVANESNRNEALDKLQTWMAARGMVPVGNPFFAYYDAPFVPGPFRRNEVMLQSR